MKHDISFERNKIEMKKTILAGFVAGLLLVGMAPAALLGQAVDDAHELESQATVYAIEASLPEQIAISGLPEEARAGDVVHLTAAYDSNEVRLDDILVNGKKAAKVSATSFYFEMPRTKAVVTASYQLFGSYEILNASASDGIILTGLPEGKLLGGEKITFRVLTAADSANTFTGEVSITYLDGAETKNVEYAESSGYYTFTMPSANVTITSEVEPQLFRVEEEAYRDENGNGDDLIYRIYAIDGEGSKTDITYNGAAYAGDTIEVDFLPSDAHIPTGLEILESGETYRIPDDAEDYVLTFTMPAHDVSLLPLADLNWVDFTINSTENIQVDLYSRDADGNYVLYEDRKAVPTTTLYLKATVLNDEIRFGGFAGTYTASWGEADYDFFSESEEGYYYFNMPNYEDFVIFPIEIAPLDIQLVNSEHLALSLYSKLDDGTYEAATNVYAGDEVYVKVEGASEDIGVKSVVLTYQMENYYGNLNNYDEEMTLNEDGYYEGMLEENGLNFSISVFESNLNAYAGYPFIGTYYIYNVYSDFTKYSTDGVGDSARAVTISASGDVSLGGYSDEETFIADVDSDPTSSTGIITLANGDILAYGPNGIYTSYGFDSLNDKDNYMGFRAEEGKDYGFVAISMGGYSADYTVQLYQAYEIFEDGSSEVIATMYSCYDSMGTDRDAYFLDGITMTDEGENGDRLPTDDYEAYERTIYHDGVELGTLTVDAYGNHTWAFAE